MILLDCVIDAQAVPMPRPRFMRGHVVSNTEEVKQWKELVAFFGLTNRRQPKPTKERCGCELTFFRESWSKRQDLDNLEKPIFDALIGIIWEDDSQIWTRTSHKATSIGQPARVRIKAWQLTGI